MGADLFAKCQGAGNSYAKQSYPTRGKTTGEA